MRPWTPGYVEYKQEAIEQVLRDGSFCAGALPPGYGYRLDERIVEYPWLFSRLPAGPGTLLDAGSVLNFEFLVMHPMLRDKKLHICTLAPEKECHWQRGISYLFDDLRRLPYRDVWFDWVVCLSTLEHVGMDNTFLYTADKANQEARPQDHLKVVDELRRVVKPGGCVYLSVPYGRAVKHGWLQVFDEPMIDSLVRAFQPAWHAAHYFLYRAEGWTASSAAQAAGATFFDIHHASGYDPDYAASSRAVCCLELTK